MTLPLTSVVIVNYNGRRVLEKCLDSLEKTRYPSYEVIIVDNGSVDGSVQFVTRRIHDNPRIRLIQNSRNVGFPAACNVGVRASKAEYVVLLNNDAEVTPRWLGELVKAAKKNGKIGVVGSKLLRMNGLLDSTGILFNHKLCNGSDRGMGEVDRGQYDDKADVLGVCFASALLRKALFERIGMLDEKTFLCYDDLDFSIRARLAGYSVRFAATSVVYHHRAASTPRVTPWTLRYGLRNRFRILLKNYSLPGLIRWGAYSWFFHLILSPLVNLAKRRFQYAVPYLYAAFWNLLNFPVKERVGAQRTRVVPDSEIFKYSTKSRW